MSDSLTDLILSLTPEDGSSIGNGAMMALLRERVPDLTDDDYAAARDALVDDGLLARGRGRGGSIMRVVDADEDEDDGEESWDEDTDDDDGFELTPTDEPAPRQRAAARGKKAARKPNGPTQVLSYRHGETRVNNPEVGMVHAGTDPDGEKTVWAYDPHLDPVLNFDSARGGIEKLIDDALERLVFQAARKTFAELSHGFSGTHEYLAAQLVRIVEAFLNSDRLDIPSLFHSDPLRRRILIALNIDLVVQHVLSNVTEQNTERLTPVFDEENPIGATGLMRTWYTTKPCFPTTKSHISHLVGDSAWEGHAANVFEKREDVLAYAKNDHLGFQIYYMWAGSRRRYVPDFLVRLAGGTILALEIKGTDSPQNKAKRDALNEWVKAINAAAGFGRWAWDVAFKPGEVQDIITKHAAVAEPAE